MKRDGWDILRLVAGWLGLAGLAALLGGLVYYGIFGDWEAWSFGLVIGGGGLVLTALVLNAPNWWEFLRSSRGVIWTNVIIVCVAGGTLCGFINYIGSRPGYNRRPHDFTARGRHTLADATKKLLDTLEVQVSIYLIKSPPRPIESDLDRLRSEALQQVEQLLPLYDHHSPRVSTRTLNVDQDRMAIAALAKQARFSSEEISDDMREGVVFIFCGRVAKPIRIDEAIDYDERAFRGEEVLSGAILSVTKNQRQILYFIEDHGERRRDEFEAPGGIGRLERLLNRLNFETRSLPIASTDEVPEDCSVLLDLGPSQAWRENEVDVLRRYLKRGGRLMRCVAYGGATGLEGLLREYGIILEDNLVLDNESAILFGHGPGCILIRLYGGHAITRRMDGPAVLTECREVTVAERRPGPFHPHEVLDLVISSRSSWAKKDYRHSDLHEVDRNAGAKLGPLSLGVAASRKRPPNDKRVQLPKEEDWRLVVFGDSDFCTNRWLRGPGAAGAGQANADLMRNSILWLVDRGEEIGIGPRKPDYRPFTVTGAAARAVFIFFVAGLPFIALVAGVLVWIIRRR